MVTRRRRTRTINEWDSQYRLHSKPVTDTRLNPDRMLAYDVEPVFRKIKQQIDHVARQTRIVSASCRWGSGDAKIHSDVSACA